MSKDYLYHYVYKLKRITRLDERPFPDKYYGSRTCLCYPLDDIKYLSSSKYIKEDIENGEQFDKEIVCILQTRDIANKVEQQLQLKYDVVRNEEFYNRRIHPFQFDNTGRKASIETRRKQSESRKGKYCGKDNPMYGKEVSLQTRKKISNSGQGKIRTSETRKRISEAQRGKHISIEQRKKMSISAMGRTVSEETKKKISESLKGNQNGKKS